MHPAAAYHHATKHHFNRFARSLGYLDWSTQPDPFRRYQGAALFELPRRPLVDAVLYPALFDGSAPRLPVDDHSIGEFLRCSMGLSAWKEYGAARWALRVNPSSGNLHPTETYVIWNGRVCHYAPREHALEQRCELAPREPRPVPGDGFLVALTSIHWREAWKYGERAFRYCQHDAGHAIGALRLAAAMLGWKMQLLPRWSDDQIATLLGVARDQDYGPAEREEVECIAVVTPGDPAALAGEDPAGLVEAATKGTWHGKANQLSADHADWPLIDQVATATRYPAPDEPTLEPSHLRTLGRTVAPSHPHTIAPLSARQVIVSRRSAVSFDPRGVLTRDAFLAMLRRLDPGAPPFDAIDWPPQVHLAVFVHRVEDLAPGLYAYLRESAVVDEWKAAMRPEFLWEPVDEGLFLLVPADVRQTANRVSCDQDIAADGFFSLGMIARFEQPLRERGDWFYRRLFWESGLVGQVLYLEAEAAGGRATGIGCYYDDPVHDLLGLTGHAWQSLYHFSMGVPVEDTRLSTEAGYAWEE